MNTREVVETELRELYGILGQRRGERNLYTEEISKLAAEIDTLTAQIAIIDGTRIFLQKLGELAREEAKNRLEAFVTQELQYVFGPHFSFRINLRGTVSRPEADFLVVTKYGTREIVNSPTSSRGGGIVDIVATALRFALLDLESPPIEGPVFLDEPFKHVSDRYRESATNMLIRLIRSSGRQVIMVTHDSQLTSVAQNAVQFTLGNDGVSRRI